MRYKPEPPPRDIDVPCVYRQTSVRRSASLQYDPFVLVSFSTSAASYALEAFDDQDQIDAYIKGEFARMYGPTFDVEVVYSFAGNHIIMDVIIGAEVPPHLSIGDQ